jgi:hypothetical protein
MRLVKTIDFRVQLILIIIGVLFCAIRLDSFYISYFIVGGWQVLSCLAHLFFPHFNPHFGRKFYLWVLLILVIWGIIALISPAIIIPYLFVLLIFSPIMAIWYCFICYKEVKLYQQKEWIQLR